MSKKSSADEKLIEVMANLMVKKAPEQRRSTPSSPMGSTGSLSPRTGQPFPPSGHHQQGDMASPGDTLPATRGSSQNVSPIPAFDSPQSPNIPLFGEKPKRSASLSPQPPPLKSLSGSNLQIGSQTTPARPHGLGLKKRPELPKGLFSTPTPPKKSIPALDLEPLTRSKSSHGLDKSDSKEDKHFEEIKGKMGKLSFSKQKEIIFNLEDLEKRDMLGEGITGKVFRMSHKPTGREMAAKKMEWSLVQGEKKRVLMDLQTMNKHNCPHIVEYYGFYVKDNEVWLYMELMTTCIDTLIKKIGPLPEPIIGTILVPIIKALDYLKRELKIIHRDVKPSNMLFNMNGEVKLCDFGISGNLINSQVWTREAGVPAFMAPERIKEIHSGYTVKADVWSLGISIVQMAEGKLPFPRTKTEFDLLTYIVDSAPPLPSKEKYSNEFNDFIAKCLTKNVAERPVYSTLLEHPFIKLYERKPENLAIWLKDKPI